MYNVIYADPPWSFVTFSNKGKGRSAEAHYDCMSLEDIKQFKFEASDNSVLLMWTTDPMLVHALDVMAAWGFQYKTIGFVWAKTTIDGTGFPIGTGYYTRANPEICLLGTRGKPVRKSRAVRKLVVAPRREHSRKPDEMYGYIEDLFDGPYLELFARIRHPGWDAVGNQTEITPRRWKANGEEITSI